MSLRSKFAPLRISTQLMLINASILVVTLLLTSFLTIAGIYFSVYHEAEVELTHSIEMTLAKLRETDAMDVSQLVPMSLLPADAEHAADPNWQPPPAFTRTLFRSGALLPGVILRIVDADGRIVVDSARHYPTLHEIESHIVENPPFWANDEMSVSILDNFHMYCKVEKITWHGVPYELHFVRMITAERDFLRTLRHALLLTNLLGIAIAVLAGYYVSRRTLRPIRTITQTAQEIEVSDLSRRIPEPPADDEMRQLVITFNRMLDRLEAGFAQQQRFVSDASHELRTPVTVMLGYADMLARWGKEDEATLDEGLSAMRSEAENMKSLIERLLFLARADLKRQVLCRAPIDMAPLFADFAKKACLVATAHETTLAQNDACTVYADAGAIRQMLRVFFDNAVKYTPTGGKITLASVRDDALHMLHVTVADTGIGIAPEHQQKVFDRFYRVDNARVKDHEVGGTGLGLSIAQWIATAHDIRLHVESEIGHGTTIHIYIPMYKESQA